MKENLLSAIKAHDFTAIRTICFGLSEEERNSLIHILQTVRWEQLYHNTQKKAPRLTLEERNYFSYSLLCLCRTSEELKEIKLSGETISSNDQMILYMSRIHFSEILNLIETQEGKYLITLFKSFSEEDLLTEFTFQNLWTLYQKGIITYNENLFIEKFFFWNNKHITDEPFVDFLLENKQISEKIFAIVPQHITQEVPYPSDAWKELYSILQAKGYFADRSIVGSHIEALLNPYKKNILDFYCRIIETFGPTRQELLSHQSTFFALLSNDKTSVVNFVMKLIKEIANKKDFDFQTFADNFALCFATQKIAKSQLIGLDILEKYYKKQAPTNTEYREQLAVLFTVPEVILQEKVAGLLTTYFAEEGLAEVVAPYRDYLKIPTPVSLPQEEEPLNKEACQDNISSSFEERFPLEVGKLQVPTTADALLFLLGDCLRERTAGTIDLFFEGLVQLQERLSANYTKELAPYLKKLMKSYYLDSVTTIIKGFLYCYSHQKPLEIPPYQYTYEESNALREKLDEAAFEEYLLWGRLYNHKTFMPFLFHKAQLTLKYLNEKEVLPFLSTPTHEPFYIDTEIFVDKLLQYEAVNKQPDLHDLIVACNRLLFKEVSAAAKEKARQLKGTYAPAIQYYLGLTDEIQLTDELLPLWTQITRIKHPDREFPEFETTSAKDIPSVVKPYYIGYGWTKWRDRDMFTFHNYDIGYDEKSEKGYWIEHYRNSFSPLYYNACGGSTPLSTEVNYLLSLNPHYPDAILCGYIANNACGAEEIRNMQLPLEAVLRYDLRVRHSGWLYIGACLLYDKRPSRDLAYEYILQALARGEDLHYVARYLSDALAMHFSPINRFVEFLDRPTRDPKVKAFQRKVVALYLEEAKKQDKLPRNHKKLEEFSH